MKSGLWILIVVVLAGVAVGYVLRDRVNPPTPADQQAELKAITELADSETKIDKLDRFISDYPKSDLKARAYTYIAREMLDGLADTTRFVGFARQAIEKETDAESKSMMYYWLYRIKADTRPEEAALIGTELLKVPVDASWIYNFIGYDLAERGRDLELAVDLCNQAIRLSKDRRDSAMCLDSRGFAYYLRGMYPEALADLEAAAALYDEPDTEVLTHLANAYLRSGAAGKAFDTFRRILLFGEYDQARAAIDSMMTAQHYSQKKRDLFEEALWQDRLAGARLATAFSMPTLKSESYAYEPAAGNIVVLNFMSPT
jgi:tetratricopeptide (TPR) repeat protein